MTCKLMNFKDWLTSSGKIISLLLTMAVGVFFPQAGILSFLVQYLLMAMLFLAFLDIKTSQLSISSTTLKVVAVNILSAFGWYLVFSQVSRELGLVAFMTAIAPTAISSTVIVGFLGGKVDFMVSAVLATNIINALVVPFALPHILSTNVGISTIGILSPVLVTMFIPFLLSRLVIYLPQPAQKVIHSTRKFSFSIWLLNLFIISAKAAHFIIYESSGTLQGFIQVAGVALIICTTNFILGAILGGKTYRQEASQALGQKNHGFTIWVALTFINPLVAMGPTVYILFHHLYNTWQIYRYEKNNKEIVWDKQISV